MADFREDTTVFPTLLKLVAALEVEYELSGLPTPQFIGLIPGDLAPIDCGEEAKCGGQAWVRLATGFPSTSFPIPDTGASCATKGMAYQIEVATSRCVTVMDNKGNPPTLQESLADTRLQLADMAAMKRAICEALRGGPKYILGQYLPLTSGGCGGGGWLITVQGV